MVNIGARASKLQTLLDIRLGPGAAVLPQDVKKINMRFNFKMHGGQLGARKFWRNFLPSLKYHNPAVSMTVDRANIEDGPATLTIYFKHSPSTTSDTSSPNLPAATINPTQGAMYDRTEVIDMKHLLDSKILSELIKVTEAVPVLTTPEDKTEMSKLHEDKERSRQDSLINLSHREKKGEKKGLLAMARGVMAE